MGNNNKSVIKRAFLKSLPVMAGYLVLGFGFGILAAKNGFGFWLAMAMSLLIYAGSMQFVTISLLTSGATLLTAILTTLLVNARHLFYGISMLSKYKKAGWNKPYLIHALTDETYSLVVQTEDTHLAFWLSLLDHAYWLTGTAIGALVGLNVTFNAAGIDFSMTTLFITVFIEQWLSTKNHLPALIGLGASLVSLVIFGPQNFLIPAMIAIMTLLIMMRQKIEQEVQENGK